MRSKRVRYFFKRAWAVWLLFHFVLFFLLFYPFFRILLSRKKWYPVAHRLRVLWGKYILLLSGMRLKAEFEATLDLSKSYVFVANHSSYLDIPSLAVGLPFFLQYMAKEELKRIPLFGIFFRTIDISVNRKSARDSHRAYLVATERLNEGGSLCVFPEGTIHASAPLLSRFKDGAFRLAVSNKAELVPVTLPDNYLRLPDDGSYTATPGPMRVVVHRPIATAHLNMEDVDALKQEVFSIIENKLKEYANYR
jgi:1-acyl-sn-glycerol-3-phosphate acyltransferase